MYRLAPLSLSQEWKIHQGRALARTQPFLNQLALVFEGECSLQDVVLTNHLGQTGPGNSQICPKENCLRQNFD